MARIGVGVTVGLRRRSCAVSMRKNVEHLPTPKIKNSASRRSDTEVIKNT